ncbi:MAG TPA: DUF5916 domain-containing protein [Longimicrobiales bacterium]
MRRAEQRPERSHSAARFDMPKIAFAVAIAAMFHQDVAAQGVPADSAEGRTASAAPAPLALAIDRAPGAIRIDGVLDDAGWANAARADTWTEFSPRKGVAPPVRTETLLTYDDDHLYIAFRAHTDPREIRATLRQRDEIWDDDLVGVLIDTYGDGASGVLLLVNARGVQGDALYTAHGDDDSYDIIYDAGARITATGYDVEMAVPFRSLRMPSRDVHTWRINLYRRHPRSSLHEMTWAPLDTDNPCVLCQSAPMSGLGGIASGGRLELLPAVVAAQAGSRESPDDAFRNGRADVAAGLGAKYTLENGWTAEAALHPDFSQVESDAAQVDVNTTFALFFPERRPFFQEGSDLFDTPVNIVYTRSINDPLAAAKLTGRIGADTRVAYLGARDEHSPFIVPLEERSLVLQGGRSISNVVRVRHGFMEDSHAGLLIADRRLDGGGSGSNVSIDGSLRFAKSYRVRAQLTASRTVEPVDSLPSPLSTDMFGRDETYTAAFDGERFAGRSTYLSLSRDARVWSFNLGYNEATPTYRAENGFQTRNDFRRANASTSVSFYPENGIDRITAFASGGALWNFGSVRKEQGAGGGVGMALPHQTNVELSANLSRERFRGVEFGGIRRIGLYVSTRPIAPVSFGMYASAGRTIARNLDTPALGRSREISLWGSLKPVPRLVIEPRWDWARLQDPNGDDIFEGYVLRARTSYQFTHELFARVVTQYNDFSKRFDFEPLLMYRINPFSIFYLGSTHGFVETEDRARVVATDRQIFLKVQYLFRL